MKKTLLFFSLFLILAASSCKKGYYYEIGAAAVSIEPDKETVSLTLAGYASPNEGRFTITWDDLGERPANSFSILSDALVSYASTLFSVVGNEIYHGDKPLVMNMPIRDISFSKNFYAINQKGELLKGEWADQTMTWTVEKPAINPPPASIISLTSDHRRLYALTADKILWQKSVSSDEPWSVIGYPNKVTYAIDPVWITFNDNKLYARDAKNHLYESRHNSVGDLQATAMSIRKNDRTVVIVGVDVCGFDKSFTDLIKEEVHQKRGIAKEAILINASHTHFAPVTQSWITWQPPNQKPDSLYLLQVVRPGIIKAIEEALDNASPSRLYLQRGTCDIGKNRTKIEGYDIYDNTVDVITAVSIKDQKKRILYLAGCHPVFTDPEVNNFTINANFPGYSRKLITDDPEIEHAIFLQAFAGDINPKDSFRKAGKQLADSVLQIMSQPTQHEIRGELSFFMDTIAIAITPPTLAEIESFKAANLPKQGEMLADRDIRWSDVMLEHYRKDRMPDHMPVYYQTLNVGDWKLVALSREVTTEFGMAIRALWPDQHVSAIAYTNDVPSYLATDPHIRAKNYEGYGSFFWYAQPKPFPLQSFDKIIDKIKHTNH